MSQTPQPKEITKTGNFVTPSEQDLIDFKFLKDEKIFVSNTTGIQYKFPFYHNAELTFFFVPLIFQNPDGTVANLWIQANPSAGNMADADAIVAARPDLELVRFPDRVIETSPKLDRFIVAPKWCTDALFTLEEIPTIQKLTQFTTILADSAPTRAQDGRFRRPQSVLNRVTGADDPEVIAKLGGVVTKNIGNTTFQVAGKDLMVDQAAKDRNVKVLNLTPTNNITNTIIGRPMCVDLISKYVVITEVRMAQPQIMTQPVLGGGGPPSGFVPGQPPSSFVPGGGPPSGFVPGQPMQQQPINVNPGIFQPEQPYQQPNVFQQPAGFQPPPVFSSNQSSLAPSYTSATTGVYAPSGQYYKLDKDIIGRLNAFIVSGKCKKGGNMTRLDTLITRIEEQSKDNYSGFSGMFLNISTCQLGAQRTDLVSRVLSFLPSTEGSPKQTLNLAMSHSDLNEIVNGTSQGRLDQATSGPLIDAVFREAETIIIGGIGSTTRNPEEGAIAVSLDVLDFIPSGPSPSGRPSVIAKIPFAETYPVPITGVSSGITAITTPASDGKRCVPGLMVKKRD